MESSEGKLLSIVAEHFVNSKLRRHMFFDGVFDNMEGMKHVTDGKHLHH